MHSECSLRLVAQFEGDLDLEMVPVGRQQYVAYTCIYHQGREIKSGPTVDSLGWVLAQRRRNLPQSACVLLFIELSYILSFI